MSQPATLQPRARPTAAASKILIEPVTPVIGAEIGGVDLSQPLDPATTQEIHAALLKWRVLFFRDQELSNEALKAFGRTLGPLTPAHPIAEGLYDHPEIWERRVDEYRVRRIENDNLAPGARRPRDYKGWHIDITFVANPTSITLLRGVEIPDFGGDTLFADLGGLYETLSPALQGFLDGLRAIHARDDGADGRPPRPRTDGRQPGPFASLHPLVRVHPETGKKVLFLSGFIRRIENLRSSESVALLDYLNAELAGRAELHARFRWTPNSLAVWDNRAVAHAGPVDGKLIAGERLVHRTTVAGDLPKGPDGFVSRPLVGELFHTVGG